MMQCVYRIRFPARCAKYAKMKSDCILYCLYRLLSLLHYIRGNTVCGCVSIEKDLLMVPFLFTDGR